MAGARVESSQFDPLLFLDADAARRRRECAFDAKTPAAARAWQSRASKALAKCLGFLDTPKVSLRPRDIERVDRGKYTRHKIILRTSAHSELPLYLLVPKKIKAKCPAVLALHGHGYGVKDIVGLWEDGRERLSPDGYHRDFGAALAERGFVVAAPEISCFGERQMRDPARFRANGMSATCHNVATYAIMLGKSAAGMRVLDGMRVIDYLQSLKYVAGDSIGAMGISGGGMHTFFSTALDPRIKACVISGYFSDWRQSILSIYHCSCNFVPGLLKLGELSDFAGLIAPRHCLIEHGIRDDIFPIDSVKKTVAKAKRTWKLLGSENDLATDYFEGRHRINGPAAYEFLAKHLGLK